MELSKQCITLEQAQKLRELKFSEHSIFNWCIGGDKCQRDWTIISEDDVNASYEEWRQAYTVSELIEYLPDTIKGYSLYIKKMYGEYIIYYATSFPKFKSNNLAQALGDMLIYLIENKYIDVNSEK